MGVPVVGNEVGACARVEHRMNESSVIVFNKSAIISAVAYSPLFVRVDRILQLVIFKVVCGCEARLGLRLTNDAVFLVPQAVWSGGVVSVGP